MNTDLATQLLFELFSGLPRQGPGCPAATRQAFSLVPPLSSGARVLDVGCGSGVQTVELARLTDARITAIDIYEPLVRKLNRKAAAEGFDGRLQAHVADMAHLDFAPGSFDLIWSEGSIFIVGFEQGLRDWRPLLKPRGYLAVSDLCWLKPDVPRECTDYLNGLCPRGVFDADAMLAKIAGCGYRCAGHFALPASAWWDDYYTPLQRSLGPFREKYPGEPALSITSGAEQEIEMFRRYSDYYGYVFFLMERAGD
ncbi:MAG TPA: class I SAM-dependent methyltransferase [Bryobacteraceae bacterium]|nr:class I SAM-dependent methyltransferase [Bryobacteraceae bacterium]